VLLGEVDHHRHKGLLKLELVVVILSFMAAQPILRQDLVAVRVEHFQVVEDIVQLLILRLFPVHL